MIIIYWRDNHKLGAGGVCRLRRPPLKDFACTQCACTGIPNDFLNLIRSIRRLDDHGSNLGAAVHELNGKTRDDLVHHIHREMGRADGDGALRLHSIRIIRQFPGHRIQIGGGIAALCVAPGGRLGRTLRAASGLGGLKMPDPGIRPVGRILKIQLHREAVHGLALFHIRTHQGNIEHQSIFQLRAALFQGSQIGRRIIAAQLPDHQPGLLLDGAVGIFDPNGGTRDQNTKIRVLTDDIRAAAIRVRRDAGLRQIPACRQICFRPQGDHRRGEQAHQHDEHEQNRKYPFLHCVSPPDAKVIQNQILRISVILC